jgi:hypothetical protein
LKDKDREKTKKTEVKRVTFKPEAKLKPRRVHEGIFANRRREKWNRDVEIQTPAKKLLAVT